MGKVIKILLQSFFDSSGVSKMRNAVRSVVGDIGDLSGSLKKLGTIFGTVGSAAGGLVANLLKGGVWGVMAEGVRMVIDLVGKWRDKEKEAAEAVEKAAKAAYEARMKAVSDYAAAVEKAHAAADKTTNEHLRLINAEVDATNNLKKALLELEAVRAKKRGDTDAAARAERELAGLDVEAAEAKMMNMMEAAANKRYDAQAYLDKLGAGREQAQAAADAESKRIAEEIANVRSKAASEAKGAMMAGIGGAVTYANATDEQRKAAADAAEAAYRQSDAYKELTKRLTEANGKVADYSSKISDAQKAVESLTADEKTLATNFDAMLASNTAKAEKAALDAEERLKATQKNIEEEKRKSLERQADAEWKADQDRQQMEREAFDERQRQLKQEEEARRKSEIDALDKRIKLYKAHLKKVEEERKRSERGREADARHKTGIFGPYQYGGRANGGEDFTDWQRAQRFAERADRDAEKATRRDARAQSRYDRIMKDLVNGKKVSDADRKFSDDFKKFQDQKDNAKNMKDALEAAQKERDQLQKKMSKTLEDIDKNIKDALGVG